MTAANPTGHPLSGQRYEDENGEWIVTYRPRIGRRRPRVQVPEGVADELEEEQREETRRRHSLAGEDRPRKKAKKKRAKKKAAKKAPRRVGSAPSFDEAVALCVADVTKKTAKRTSRRKQDTGQRELFDNPPGAPNLARLGTVTELGRVRSLLVQAPDGRHLRHRWKRNHPRLLWSPKQKCLFWVMGGRPYNRESGAVRSDGAARTFERWSKRAAAKTYTIKVPRRKLKVAGHAIQIIYSSDKWEQKEDYRHEFSASVKAYNAGSLWAVRGGALTVTERGIVY